MCAKFLCKRTSLAFTHPTVPFGRIGTPTRTQPSRVPRPSSRTGPNIDRPCSKRSAPVRSPGARNTSNVRPVETAITESPTAGHSSAVIRSHPLIGVPEDRGGGAVVVVGFAVLAVDELAVPPTGFPALFEEPELTVFWVDRVDTADFGPAVGVALVVFVAAWAGPVDHVDNVDIADNAVSATPREAANVRVAPRLSRDREELMMRQ